VGDVLTIGGRRPDLPLQAADRLGESGCHWRSWPIWLLARTRSTRW